MNAMTDKHRIIGARIPMYLIHITICYQASYAANAHNVPAFGLSTSLSFRVAT